MGVLGRGRGGGGGGGGLVCKKHIRYMFKPGAPKKKGGGVFTVGANNSGRRIIMLHSALEKETKNTQADNMECYTNEKKSWSLKKKNIFPSSSNLISVPVPHVSTSHTHM